MMPLRFFGRSGRAHRLHLHSVGAPVAGAVISAIVLAACSSAGSGTTSSTGGHGSTNSIAAAPGAQQSLAEIKHAYSVLFNLSNPAVAPKLAVVQGGSSLQATFVRELKSPLAKEAHGAEVVSTSLLAKAGCQSEALPSPCAKVIYDILAPGGKVLLSHSVGFAVYEAPSWKVSKTTICTLLTLANGNTAPAGC